jgi:hypothetical protein
VVVSESAVVRLFDDGELVSEVLPELWMLHRYGSALWGVETSRETEGELTVVRKKEDP